MHCSPPTAIVTLGPAASASDPAPPNTSSAAARATPPMRRDRVSARMTTDIYFLRIFSTPQTIQFLWPEVEPVAPAGKCPGSRRRSYLINRPSPPLLSAEQSSACRRQRKLRFREMRGRSGGGWRRASVRGCIHAVRSPHPNPSPQGGEGICPGNGESPQKDRDSQM